MQEAIQKAANAPTVSLCICTMNRPDDLHKCITSARQCAPPPDEIIVSDDSNQEAMQAATAMVCATFPGIIYQSGPRAGLGANRNACIERASGNYIHLSDDDVTLPANFYAEAMARLATSPKAILTGEENRHADSGVYRIAPQNADFWGFQQVPQKEKVRGICIGATLFPAALFSEARFDAKLRYGSDEIDIARHALSLGYEIVHSDRVVIDHYPSPVNRAGYNRLADASRLYSTTKAYWRYERAPLKALAYIVLAPLHLVGSALKSRKRERIVGALQAVALAGRYLVSGPKNTFPSNTGRKVVAPVSGKAHTEW